MHLPDWERQIGLVLNFFLISSYHEDSELNQVMNQISV